VGRDGFRERPLERPRGLVHVAPGALGVAEEDAARRDPGVPPGEYLLAQSEGPGGVAEREVEEAEVVLDPEQLFEPKLAARQLPDGKIVSPSLEDMWPFLPRQELQQNMLVPLVN